MEYKFVHEEGLTPLQNIIYNLIDPFLFTRRGWSGPTPADTPAYLRQRAKNLAAQVVSTIVGNYHPTEERGERISGPDWQMPGSVRSVWGINKIYGGYVSELDSILVLGSRWDHRPCAIFIEDLTSDFVTARLIKEGDQAPVPLRAGGNEPIPVTPQNMVGFATTISNGRYRELGLSDGDFEIKAEA